MYVQTRFVLPSITAPNGLVIDPRSSFVPGPCKLDPRRGVRYASPASKRFVAGPRRSLVKMNGKRMISAPLTPAPVTLGSFWSTLIGGSVQAGRFAASLNPITAVATGIIGAVKGKGNQQQPAQKTSSLGPLATVSTGTILGISLGAGALLLAIARH